MWVKKKTCLLVPFSGNEYSLWKKWVRNTALWPVADSYRDSEMTVSYVLFEAWGYASIHALPPFVDARFQEPLSLWLLSSLLE